MRAGEPMYAAKLYDPDFKPAQVVIVFDGIPDIDLIRHWAKLNPPLPTERISVVARWRNRKHFLRWVHKTRKHAGKPLYWNVVTGSIDPTCIQRPVPIEQSHVSFAVQFEATDHHAPFAGC